MNLSPMRYKNYIWPHNPRIYEIEFRNEVASHRVPGGQYIMQYMGRSFRVLRGEGEFAGEGAYAEFSKLATVFYERKPGELVHPVWQASNAYFVSLSLRQEPAEDYVAYAFEFWESFDGYDSGIREVTAAAPVEKRYHTMLSGESLWSVAAANGLTARGIVSLNPQIKDISEVRAGTVVRVA